MDHSHQKRASHIQYNFSIQNSLYSFTLFHCKTTILPIFLSIVFFQINTGRYFYRSNNTNYIIFI